MTCFTDLTSRDASIQLGDLVEGIVNGTMSQSCHEHPTPIVHQQARQVSEHQGFACARRTLNEMQQVCAVGQGHGFDLAFVEVSKS